MSRSKSHDDFGRLRQSLRQVPVLRKFSPGNGVKSAVVMMALCMIGLWLVVIEGSDYLQVCAKLVKFWLGQPKCIEI